MNDCKNTVIVTGLGHDIKKEDFIQHFKRFGEILKSNLVTTGSEGRVTYADSETAEEAVKELDGKEINGNVIKVKLMDKCHNNDNIHDADNGNNTTNKQKDIPCDEHQKKKFGGGKGGKGGTGGSNVPSGHDGEDGEPGPGGKGGAGGRPAITNPKLGKRAFESNGGLANNMKNQYKCTGGGKGGKGGIGAPNVSSGNDGEDGEPGPGGKGGAGGRPAVSKNAYTWNANWNNVPWYTRWLGIAGPKKTNEQEHNSSGGGKGGKGGVGYNNVPSGHDGEDGEAGPGGKGGVGGRPAM